MKGQEESEMAIGVLIFAIGTAAVFGFIQANILLVSTRIEVARGEMEAVDMAHLVAKCLSDEGIILQQQLNEGRLESCGLGPVSVLISDMETGKEIWRQGKPDGEHSYSLQSPVMLNDGKIIGGEILVRI